MSSILSDIDDVLDWKSELFIALRSHGSEPTLDKRDVIKSIVQANCVKNVKKINWKRH